MIFVSSGSPAQKILPAKQIIDQPGYQQKWFGDMRKMLIPLVSLGFFKDVSQEGRREAACVVFIYTSFTFSLLPGWIRLVFKLFQSIISFGEVLKRREIFQRVSPPLT